MPTQLIVHRSTDRVIILVPDDAEDTRNYAIINEDESFCASSAIKKIADIRSGASIEIGEFEDKLRVDRVNHATLPFELVFEDAAGRMVLDLTKVEAMIFADMLWGAHRAQNFYMSTTVANAPRRRQNDPVTTWTVSQAELARARNIGEAQRRARGEPPMPKT